MKINPAIENIHKRAIMLCICIALLTLTTLFAISQHFIAPKVMPKWYFSVYPFALLVILGCVWGIMKGGSRKRFEQAGFIRAVYGVILGCCFFCTYWIIRV